MTYNNVFSGTLNLTQQQLYSGPHRSSDVCLKDKREDYQKCVNGVYILVNGCVVVKNASCL